MATNTVKKNKAYFIMSCGFGIYYRVVIIAWPF